MISYTPVTPVFSIPSTNLRCVKAYKINSGKIDVIIAAAFKPALLESLFSEVIPDIWSPWETILLNWDNAFGNDLNAKLLPVETAVKCPIT